LPEWSIRRVTVRILGEMAVEGLVGASTAMVSAHPGGRVVRGEKGALLLITGGVASPFNRVMVAGREADVGEVRRFAEVLRDSGVPWSLWVRGEPDNRVVGVAAEHGLVERGTMPLMAVARGDARLRGARSGAPRVRAITSAERQLHGDLIGGGYGLPAEMYLSYLAAPLMDAPWATTYVAELDGVPVATAYSVRSGDYIVVYSVAVPPEYRGRGYGRLMTERVMTDAFEKGATAAILESSDDGFPLYRSMGFATVETWTYLT
jgi:GNAT superfamily N-acetyltransferase